MVSLGGLLVFLTVTLLPWLQQLEAERLSGLMAEKEPNIKLVPNGIQRLHAPNGGDICMATSTLAVHAFFRSPTEGQHDHVTEFMLGMTKAYGRDYQVRLIDVNGVEKVRVDV